MFIGVAIWTWMESVTFINIVQIILTLFNPYVLLFSKLLSLSLSEQHSNLRLAESQLLCYHYRQD